MDLRAGGYGDQLVAALSAATDLLADLPARVSRLTGPDLDVVLPVIDRLAALAGAGRYTMTRDAESRGEVASSQAGTTAQWVAERCPSLDAREAGLVAKAVRELARPQLGTAADAVAAGRLSVPAGCVVAAEWRQLEPLSEPTAGEAVLAGLVTMGGVDGSAGVRRLRPALLAKYGLGERLQDIRDRHVGLTVLSCGRDIGGGITEYRLRLNPEARAVVEAAINALSAPKVVDGVRDSRTVDQRRGDALVQVCRRATAATAMVTRAGANATVIVTIGLDDLRHRCRPGVLAGTGQILDLGSARRAFTSAQHRALWLRDRHCTFPGCTVPGTWADAHHIRHWADGGNTDLDRVLRSMKATPPPCAPRAVGSPPWSHPPASAGTAGSAATTTRWPADRRPLPRRRAVASAGGGRAVRDGRGIQATGYCAVAWAARRTPATPQRGGKPPMTSHVAEAKLTVEDKSLTLPGVPATDGADALGISALLKDTGTVTYDAGFVNTASCKSAITYIDGDAGILRYRGYPIEQLAERSSFVEVCYLLIYGELPSQTQLAEFEDRIRRHTMLHEDLKAFFSGFPRDAHPMPVLSSAVSALSTFYQDSLDPFNNAQVELSTVRLLAKLPTIAAYAHKKSVGQPFLYPDNSLTLTENFLRMTFGFPAEPYEIDPTVVKALDLLLILHADHEQNCSTSTVRLVGSAQANLFASVSAGINALFGPLHGGANQAVLEMLERIQNADYDVDTFMKKVKNKEDGVRLMGFGHRVYKNYDPRAAIIKKTADEIINKLGGDDEMLDIAKQLESIALEDDYFVERKLYPNVDFYTGLIYKAMGFPSKMFTVLFAIGRLPGWIAQWREMIQDPETKIGRPRQVYIGATEREYAELSQR